jgi:hypothetical protein
MSSGKKAFVITMGHAASGTSFLTRALHLCGLYIGLPAELLSTIFSPVSYNRKGTWENKLILDIGGHKYEGDSRQALKQLAREMMGFQSFASGAKAGSGTYPLLVDVLNECGYEHAVFAIFRHPLITAESQRRRIDRSYEETFQKWNVVYSRILEGAQTHSKHTFFFNFSWDRTRLIKEISDCAYAIGLLPNERAIAAWFDSNLLKADHSYDASYKLDEETTELYNKLIERADMNKQMAAQFAGDFTKCDERSPQELVEIMSNWLYCGHQWDEYNASLFAEERLKLSTPKPETISLASPPPSPTITRRAKIIAKKVLNKIEARK